MGNFISDQLVKHLNQRLAQVGSVEALDLERDALKVTLKLRGDEEEIRLEFSGISWFTEDGKFNLRYDNAYASREWIQGVLGIIREKSGNAFSMPDAIHLMPLKMLFPKAR
ncbi:MAG: hypothetical protein LBD01_03820 [Puniceicoccales bacterium]|jgi:hypothetical protein|nr:hypothetical protein [Puniceicoccales bacterium]